MKVPKQSYMPLPHEQAQKCASKNFVVKHAHKGLCFPVCGWPLQPLSIVTLMKMQLEPLWLAAICWWVYRIGAGSLQLCSEVVRQVLQWGQNTPKGILTHRLSQEGGREPPTASQAVLQSKLWRRDSFSAILLTWCIAGQHRVTFCHIRCRGWWDL